MPALLWSWDPPLLRHDFKEGPGAVQYVPKVELTIRLTIVQATTGTVELRLIVATILFILLFCLLDSCLLVLLLPMHLTLKSRYSGLTVVALVRQQSIASLQCWILRCGILQDGILLPCVPLKCSDIVCWWQPLPDVRIVSLLLLLHLLLLLSLPWKPFFLVQLLLLPVFYQTLPLPRMTSVTWAAYTMKIYMKYNSKILFLQIC